MKIYENLDINDLDGEIWKDILDYEGDYQVSNIGRVKSFKQDKISGKIMKQQKRGDYFKINLCKNGKKKSKLINRLVFEVHKEKLKEGHDTHHINKNKEYNFIGNLESKEHGKHVGDHSKGKIISEETRKKRRK